MSAADEAAAKELEAERLWWAEASERQVKELESNFDTESGCFIGISW